MNSQIYQNRAARYEGDYGGNYANAITSDNFFNLYVTGTVKYTAGLSKQNCITLKYNPCGENIWANEWNSDVDQNDYGNDIVVNSSNNIIVGGESYFSIFFGYQYLALKYTAESQNT